MCRFRAIAGFRRMSAAGARKPCSIPITPRSAISSPKGDAPAIVAIHSFTPVFENFQRPWHVGILWNEDARLAKPIMAELARDPSRMIGDNEPYSARGEVGYTIKEHAEKAGRLHLMIEIRQDLIAGAEGAARWGDIVGDALAVAAAGAGLALAPVAP